MSEAGVEASPAIPEAARAPPNFDAIPAELRALPQWVLWRREERGGKSTKVPVQAKDTLRRASSTDPETWATFEEAREAFNLWHEHGRVNGIGFVFTREAGIVGIDVDHCRAGGEWDIEALELTLAVRSYAEVSPSGEGLHVFAYGSIPGNRNRRGNVEIYETGRYFTVTGAHLDGTPTAVREASPGSIEALYATIAGGSKVLPGPGESPTPDAPPTDEEVLRRCKEAKNSPKFLALWKADTTAYDSPSEADLALCNILAYHAGNDYGTVDRLFRRSMLYREKWDERRGRFTYGERTVQKAIADRLSSPQAARFVEAPDKTEDQPPDKTDLIAKELHCTDLGNSERLIHRYGTDLRYCTPHNSWYLWNHRVWLADRFDRVQAYAKATAKKIHAEALAEEEDKRKKELGKWATASESEHHITAMLKLARSDVSIPPELLDGDPNLLNLQNGTLELDTLTFRDHRREDLCTKLAGVSFDKNSKCPKWDAHLRRIFANDDEFIRSFQELMGYGLLFGNPWRYFPIFHGRGANGKSVILSVTRSVLGDYATAAAPSTFMEQKNDGRPRPDILALKGARIVTATETKESKRLAEDVVKAMTGGDTMSYRGLYKEEEQFDPAHLAILASNYMPTVRGQDQGIWDRLLRVPFEISIPKEERIPNYEQELMEEGSGIFNWFLEGLRRYYENGDKVTIHPKMIQATTQYREDMDFLKPFIEDFCIKDAAEICTKSELYKRYKEWCEMNGERPLSTRGLRNALVDRDFAEDRNMTARIWKGIRPKRPDELSEELKEACNVSTLDRYDTGDDTKA